MKKTIAVSLLTSLAVLSQGMDTAMVKTVNEVAKTAHMGEYAGTNGSVLPYRLLSPELKEGETAPLVVFLHGAGERGNNNVSQLVHAHALSLVYSPDENGFLHQGLPRKAFILFPQCASGSQWVLVPWGDKTPSPMPKEPSPGLQNVHELVAKLKAELPIDASRVYVTGISMGGYGTWDYITRWPDEVAAAIVVCGGASNESVASDPRVNTIPIRIFHGSLDGAVPVERGRSAFEAIKATNRKATYTEYGKEGHGIWARAYAEPGLGEWLFSHHK